MPLKIPASDKQLLAMSTASYMNAAQRAFFRQRLLQMRDVLLARETEIGQRLRTSERCNDETDRASAEAQYQIDLRLRERETTLCHKIDNALRRLARGDYGWCQISGEAIGLRRLLARPTATECVDVKADNELREHNSLQR